MCSWADFDPDAKQTISIERLSDLVKALPQPMGLQGAPRSWCVRVCLNLGLEPTDSGELSFSNVLQVLVRYNYTMQAAEDLANLASAQGEDASETFKRTVKAGQRASFLWDGPKVSRAQRQVAKVFALDLLRESNGTKYFREVAMMPREERLHAWREHLKSEGLKDRARAAFAHSFIGTRKQIAPHSTVFQAVSEEEEMEAREMAAAMAEAEAQAAREEEEEVSAAKMQALARARHARGEVHVRRQQSREQAMGGTSAAAAHGAGGSGGALPVQLRQLLAVEDRAVTYRARPALTPSELTSHQQPTPLAPPPPPPPPPVQAVPIVTGSRPSATGGLAWQQVTMTTVTTTSTTTEHAEAAEGAATAGAGAGPMAIRRPAALTVSGPPDGSSRCEGDGGSSSAGSSRAQSIVAEPTGESSWAGVGSHEASPLPRLPPHMLSPAGPPSRGRSADEFLARLREAELRDRDGAEIGRDGALASLEHRDDAGSADRTAGRAGRSGGSRKGPPPPPPQGDGSPSPST